MEESTKDKATPLDSKPKRNSYKINEFVIEDKNKKEIATKID